MRTELLPKYHCTCTTHFACCSKRPLTLYRFLVLAAGLLLLNLSYRVLLFTLRSPCYAIPVLSILEKSAIIA